MSQTETEIKAGAPLIPGVEYVVHRLYTDGSALVVAYTLKAQGHLEEVILTWATVGALTADGWKSWGMMTRPALARIRGKSDPRPVRVVVPSRPYPVTHLSLPALVPLSLMDRGREVDGVVYIELGAHHNTPEE